jgi:cysteine desulfurase
MQAFRILLACPQSGLDTDSPVPVKYSIHRSPQPMTAPNALIYLDNNATTRVDPAVLEAMLPFLTDFYGNPSSAYRFGKQVDSAIETARAQVAGLLDCEPQEVVFTSCGTEATNAAILSALSADPDRQHVVTTRVEHSATLKLCEKLAKRGVEITWLGVDARGRIDLEEVRRAVRPDTALLTTMWANNETGTLFPIAELERIARGQGVYFHSDAVQVAGKLPLQMRRSDIQFLSLSGHKLHAPKGVGALYINRKTRFSPLLIGGSQEQGRRGGTQNVASIVAFGKACELAAATLEAHAEHVRVLRDHFEGRVLSEVPGVSINGDPENRLPNTTNLAFENVDSEALLLLLDEQGVCCSAGSACTSGSINPSHVLKAMGHSDAHARSSLRISFSKYNTLPETDDAVAALAKAVAKIRSL